MEELPQINDPVRRRLILDEAYYEHYDLQTHKEANHPFHAVLALESENWYKHSIMKTRLERYFELEVGNYGIGLEELLSLPRFYVEEIFRIVTDLKAKKTKSTASSADELEKQLREFGGKV